MNVPLFAHSAVVAPLQCLARWILSRASVASSNAQRRPTYVNAVCSHSAAKRVAPHLAKVASAGRRPALAKPLRIVRVLEAGQARSAVGRMVISGRMADVCAELDRLAAREAALS